jgi:predicted TIM-barrel fold metal-dependent hydrolase
MKRIIISLVLSVVALGVSYAQPGNQRVDPRFPTETPGIREDNIRLVDWQPRSALVVKETHVMKPKFPVIDIHNHLRRGLAQGIYDQYVEAMNEAGVWMVIDLDGNSVEDGYKNHVAGAAEVDAADRIKVYFRPDFSRIDEKNWGESEAARLEDAVLNGGVRGLKINKALGLSYKDASGEVFPVDDPRIDPIWAKCGELGIPVMIHVSDPVAFHYGPVDRFNERYEELQTMNSFYGEAYPYTKEEIMAQRNRMIAKHPETIFIGAHVCDLAEDLGRVSMWLDQYPNYYVDISARINELGRQPYTARRFMIQHQDRILFGTDTAPTAEAFRLYYRVLETDDEYFDTTPAHKLQGRWMVYGLNLPDEVLEKVYNKNALKIMGMFKGGEY